MCTTPAARFTWLGFVLGFAAAFLTFSFWTDVGNVRRNVRQVHAVLGTASSARNRHSICDDARNGTAFVEALAKQGMVMEWEGNPWSHSGLEAIPNRDFVPTHQTEIFLLRMHSSMLGPTSQQVLSAADAAKLTRLLQVPLPLPRDRGVACAKLKVCAMSAALPLPPTADPWPGVQTWLHHATGDRMMMPVFVPLKNHIRDIYTERDILARRWCTMGSCFNSQWPGCRDVAIGGALRVFLYGDINPASTHPAPADPFEWIWKYTFGTSRDTNKINSSKQEIEIVSDPRAACVYVWSPNSFKRQFSGNAPDPALPKVQATVQPEINFSHGLECPFSVSKSVCFDGPPEPGSNQRRWPRDRLARSTSITSATSAADCCHACDLARPRCTHWTYNSSATIGSRCYLKTMRPLPGRRSPECISGVVHALDEVLTLHFAELPLLPHWNIAGGGGTNHLLVQPQCSSHCDTSFDFASPGPIGNAIVASPNMRRGLFRPGFDLPLPGFRNSGEMLDQICLRGKQTHELSGERGSESSHDGTADINSVEKPRPLLAGMRASYFDINMHHQCHRGYAQRAAANLWSHNPARGLVLDVNYGTCKKESEHLFNYTDLLLSSAYSICPSGFGLWSYRLTEAIAAESVPVVGVDDVLPWEGISELTDDIVSCVVRLSNTEWFHIEDVLRALGEPGTARYKERQSACRRLKEATFGATSNPNGSCGTTKDSASHQLFWHSLKVRIKTAVHCS